MRRKFRELNPTIGTPTLEGVHRPTDRRYFEQLTLGHNRVIPTPYIGRMYRTYEPVTIADYEGISDTNWSLGVTGDITGSSVPNSSFNCYYYHFTVPNQRTSTVTYKMQPVRFSCNMPATPGATYDFWVKDPANNVSAWGLLSSGFQVGLGAMAVIDTMLVPGSHATFKDGTAKLLQLPDWMRHRQNPVAFNDFLESALEAIAPTVAAVPYGAALRITHIRHRINGSAVSVLYELTPNQVTSSSSFPISTGTHRDIPISPGDVYEIDVWYEITYKPQPNLPSAPGKACFYHLLSRVSNGSKRRRATGADPTNIPPWIILENVDYSPNFSRTEHTYNITLNGHAGWTLKDGSNGPHKMVNTGGWKMASVPGVLTWTAPSGTGWVKSIALYYDREIAHVAIEWGAEFRLNVISRTYAVYRPANSGDYNTQTVSTDEGTINHAPCGVFNQGGSTTFNLVTWSAGYESASHYNTGFKSYLDGRKSGGLIPTYIEVPTTITLSRTTL